MTTEKKVGLWLHFAGIVAAALVAYFTTQASIQAEIAGIKATQMNQFQEVLRRLDVMQVDIRELRVR